jgi:hypothetical protein
MTERRKLSDILRQSSDHEKLSSLWKTTAAAEEFKPLPRGEYTFRILAGEPFRAKRGTPGYKLTLEVTEGEYEGRRAWHDLWLTELALAMTKRDLAKIGIVAGTFEDLVRKLDRPLPQGILIRGKVAVRTDDEGNDSNRLIRFDFIGVEKGDAFEPAAEGPAEEPFPFGANVPPSTNGAQGPKEAAL